MDAHDSCSPPWSDINLCYSVQFVRPTMANKRVWFTRSDFHLYYSLQFVRPPMANRTLSFPLLSRITDPSLLQFALSEANHHKWKGTIYTAPQNHMSFCATVRNWWAPPSQNKGQKLFAWFSSNRRPFVLLSAACAQSANPRIFLIHFRELLGTLWFLNQIWEYSQNIEKRSR